MKKLVGILMIVSSIMVFAGCQNNIKQNDNNKIQVVATTTMLRDLVEVLGGDLLDVTGLMGPGIDPHLYKASAGDVTTMQNADIVVYGGLHLEGTMGEIFEQLGKRGKLVVCATEGIEPSRLLLTEDGVYDPHVWFNVSLWKEVAKEVSKSLQGFDEENQEIYEQNLVDYLEELEDLDQYIKEKSATLEEDSRVLITAHDAFNYFGEAYGFEVRGLQGISTEAEAGTKDVRDLADFIIERNIKAVFIESSIPRKNIEALQEAVKAQGHDLKIGGELYSDSLGDKDSNEGTYIGTFKANIDTIVDGLK